MKELHELTETELITLLNIDVARKRENINIHNAEYNKSENSIEYKYSVKGVAEHIRGTGSRYMNHIHYQEADYLRSIGVSLPSEHYTPSLPDAASDKVVDIEEAWTRFGNEHPLLAGVCYSYHEWLKENWKTSHPVVVDFEKMEEEAKEALYPFPISGENNMAITEQRMAVSAAFNYLKTHLQSDVQINTGKIKGRLLKDLILTPAKCDEVMSVISEFTSPTSVDAADFDWKKLRGEIWNLLLETAYTDAVIEHLKANYSHIFKSLPATEQDGWLSKRWTEILADRSNEPDEAHCCLWMKHPVCEPPYVGGIADIDFTPNYFTHFIILKNEDFNLPTPPTDKKS